VPRAAIANLASVETSNAKSGTSLRCEFRHATG
jgi:hypothetical protein